MKLNYRHSLKSMQQVAEKFGYRISFYAQAGKHVFEVLEKTSETENGYRTCGVYYRETDIAAFLNAIAQA